MLPADEDLAALPAIANFIKRRLQHFEANVFNRAERERFFEQLSCCARIIGDKSIHEADREATEALRLSRCSIFREQGD